MPSRDPKLLTPLLQEFWPLLRNWYMKKYPGRAIFLTCTHRPVKEQAAIYAKNAPGRILTRCDGVIKVSKHNYQPAKAFDVAISIKGKVVWEDGFYTPLGGAIKDLGYEDKVRWGGWWTFHDFPHFEET